MAFPKIFKRVLILLPLIECLTILVNTEEIKLERLLLSKLIKSGNVQEARESALIKWNQDSLDGITTYTGYLTVNETTNSNLFFWFIPALNEEPTEAPVMLWLNGNSDTSSTSGLFVENGPFNVKKRGRITRLVLRLRKETWARKHSMIYIDNPVGTGLSFTDSDDGYAKNVEDVTRDLYNGLEQFFTLFSDYSKQPFYIAGESYAGKYAPHLALKIHNSNKAKSVGLKINLAGIAVGGPLTDPLSMTNKYSDYLYYLGLINNETKSHLKDQEVLTTKLIEEGKLEEALTVNEDLISYFKNQSGFNLMSNALESRASRKRTFFIQYLNSTAARKMMHIGDQTLYNTSTQALQMLRSDLFKSYKSEMEQIIDLKYKVLIYVGQFDLITPHVAVASFIDSMNFNSKSEYEKTDRKILLDRKKGDVSGFVKSAGNFSYVVLRNAGHNVPRDQPRWCREIIESFVNGSLL